MQILYRNNAKSIGSWRIWSEGSVIHISHTTVLGGSEVHHTEEVEDGKQGRSLDEQVASRIASRISRMRDKGYKDSIEDAQVSSGTNQMGLLRPMLAQPIDKVSSVVYEGAVQQKKLNGHRCLVTNQDGEIIAYSRQGKPIPAIKHIIQALKNRLPPEVTIDGELYVHGAKLQTIASWVKAEQPNTVHVNLVLYDIISNESYMDRYEELASIAKGVETNAPGKVLILPYERAESLERIIKRRDEVIKAGFEGMMLRLDKRSYQVGIRSSSLLKVKKFNDAEFVVINVVASEKNWGICECITIDGRTFRVSAPGNIDEKTDVLVNKSKYIGKMLTVEYAELTADGIPFHCSATGWKEEL